VAGSGETRAACDFTASLLVAAFDRIATIAALSVVDSEIACLQMAVSGLEEKFMSGEQPLNKSLIKALSIMESFKNQPHELSFSEIVSLNKMDKSSVQRLVQTLRHSSYIVQPSEGQKYSLGIRVLDLAYAFLQSHPLIERVGPYIAELRQASGERVDLSIPDGTDLVYILRMQSKRDRYALALPGRRLPLYCTAGGRAVLAHMAPDQAQTLLGSTKLEARTPSTLTDPSQIMGHLKKIREVGFAFQQEEVRKGVVAVGAAVLDRAGAPVGAVHITGSLSDWDGEEFRRKMGALIIATAGEANLF
jgi:DNA-binding IclR family transcriptional regulator